ncbi:plasmid replication/partition related protein [Xylophilus sp. GOD-11R]|uniref:plasmid replication/partition related protein n=1 Tax=Xylophilus sp. GOD-11R TaxID=3089814 RepID=UPI00298C8CDB|nr:plasmid replication/partition related protein [Xylophilus sp. GOD-11R]WPB54954.1 plasmid replication/partition related protein [Xylophilus sp. GOD-11R]
MNIVVNEELKAYIDPLTPEEHDALERSLLAEGCRDALVLWGDVLVDGHNRYGICLKHGLPFNTVQNTRFQSMEDVHLWMIDQHLGRRSVSDFQRGVLALRKKQIVAQRQAAPQSDEPAHPSSGDSAPWDSDDGTTQAVSPVTTVPSAPALNTREAVAKAARLSSAQVAAIEKIQKQAAPELVAAVRAGAVSINTAATIASLPAEEQVAAASGGKDDLRQAAKRVRDARRKPRDAPEGGVGSEEAEDQAADMVLGLRRRVEELTAENQALRAEVESLRAMLV